MRIKMYENYDCENGFCSFEKVNGEYSKDLLDFIESSREISPRDYFIEDGGEDGLVEVYLVDNDRHTTLLGIDSGDEASISRETADYLIDETRTYMPRHREDNESDRAEIRRLQELKRKLGNKTWMILYVRL